MKSGTHGGSTKFDVCIDTLMNGCVNAYVQLFTLSHRDPVCVDELAQTMFSIPDEKLTWVQDALINAEMMRRRSDFRGAFNEAVSLSQYFESEGDKDQAIHQHQIALQYGMDSLDRALEADAHESFGLLHERLGMIKEAALHHETSLKLAEIADLPEMKLKASKNMLRVYMRCGEEALPKGEVEEAKSYFERAVVIAKASGQTKEEAEAYAALGNVTVLLGDLNKALEYQKRFMLVSRDRRNDHSESVAALQVGRLQESLGKADEAIATLKSSLALAEQSNDLQSICDACRQLGEVYQRNNERVKAVHYFNQSFKAARDIGNPQTVEDSRIALGFALGEHYFLPKNDSGATGYLSVVVDDMPTYLQWMSSGSL